MSTEWNPKPYNARLRKALLAGVDEAGMAISTHIKVEYQRPITGKGFTDITGDLRKSIHSIAFVTPRGIRGQIIAGGQLTGGVDYAEHVEHVAGGKYAYMLPGFLEKRSDILPTVIRRARLELKLG